MDTTAAGPFVTIPAARLAELEELAAFALKVKAQQAARLAKLNERNKATPEAISKRVKKWQDANREAYNARRRELRRLKREAEAAAESPGAD
jgi:hypothetical protein